MPMFSHKLNNLLKLYKTASRIENVNTICHCANELDKILAKLDGQEVDPVARLYLKDLKTIHQSCREIVKRKMIEMAAA